MVDGQSTRQLERNPPNAQTISLAADQNENSSFPTAVSVHESVSRGRHARCRSGRSIPISGLAAIPPSSNGISVSAATSFEYFAGTWLHGIEGCSRRVLYAGKSGYPRRKPSESHSPSQPASLSLCGEALRMRTTGGDGISDYNAAYIKFEKRFSGGLSFLTHYTFGKALDYSSQVNETTRTPFDPRLSKGRSLFDIRSRMVFSATYELPVGRGRPFLSSGNVVSRILGNWQTNTIISLQSGFPYYVGVSGDLCNCTVRPARRLPKVGNPLSGFTQSRTQWFNTSAFVNPVTGTFGTSGRNILSRPLAGYRESVSFQDCAIERTNEAADSRRVFQSVQPCQLWTPGQHGRYAYLRRDYIRR